MKYYCGMCDRWFTKSGECRLCGFDLEAGEPPRADDCKKCGSGWTFDFATKRVTCQCDKVKE